MNCSWKYVFIRRLERGHHLSYLYNISLKVLQCRVGEGQYEEDVVVTMFAERQNVVLHGQHGDDGSLPGRGQRGDPEPGVTGDLHSYHQQEWTVCPALKEGRDHQLRHQELHAQQGPEGQFPRHFHRPTWRSLQQLLKGAVGRID